jgi:hypothetical protein
MDLKSIRNRLVRIAATVAPSREDEPISVRMYNAGLSREDALAALWVDELLAASHGRRAPDPQRPLDWLRIFDCTTWPLMIRRRHWDHRQCTSFAYDFRTWSLAEVSLFAKLGDLGARFTDEEEAALEVLAPRIESLEAAAEEVWRADEETIRFLSTRGEPC